MLATCAAWTLVDAPALAAPQMFVTLTYEIAPGTRGCPDANEFRSSVERQVGYTPFRPSADRRVHVQIGRDDGGFDARIRWSDAGGHWVGDRRITSQRSECGEIAASVAFAVAVQVQLMATLASDNTRSAAPSPTSPSPPLTSPAPSPSSPAASATSPGPSPSVPGPAPEAPTPGTTPTNPNPTPVAPATGTATAAASRKAERAPDPTTDLDITPVDPTAPESPAAPETPEGLRGWSVGVGPSLALGFMPQPTALGRMFVSYGLGRISVEAAADAALPITQLAEDGSGFTLDRISFSLAPCGRLGAFAACLTGVVGRMQARGFGVDEPASPEGLFWQLGARVTETHYIGERYFAAARVELLFLLSPSTVTLNNNPVWSTPSVGGTIGLDIGARIF